MTSKTAALSAPTREPRAKPAETRKVGRPRKGAGGLTLKQIITEAWAIVDRHGIAKLSTRTLAAALNVQSPALYWYVKSKDELLSLMMENLLQDSLTEHGMDMEWQDWLKQVARRQRDLLLAHRDSGMIAALAPPSEMLRSNLFPRLFEPLLTAGISPRQAGTVLGGLASFVLGWVLYEQRPETRAFAQTFHAPDEGFEFALDALIRGVSVKLAGQPRD